MSVTNTDHSTPGARCEGGRGRCFPVAFLLPVAFRITPAVTSARSPLTSLSSAEDARVYRLCHCSYSSGPDRLDMSMLLLRKALKEGGGGGGEEIAFMLLLSYTHTVAVLKGSGRNHFPRMSEMLFLWRRGPSRSLPYGRPVEPSVRRGEAEWVF